MAVLSTFAEKGRNKDQQLIITQEIMADSIQVKSQNFDANGDGHYDLVSAFQKSIRGSDTDAALHYLARLIESGDLISICRRLLVIAYEDIGLANPAACQHAALAVRTAQQIGLPEARIPLSNAVIELALSPKSNSAISAVDTALDVIRTQKVSSIPNHLKDSHYSGAKKLGHGNNYLYPHDYTNDWVAQQYLPSSLIHDSYFRPKGNSKIELALKNQYQRLKQMQENGLDNH